MRIIVRSSTWSREESGGIKERVVLWSGPKEEVWDQGEFIFYFRIFFLSGSRIIDLFVFSLRWNTPSSISIPLTYATRLRRAFLRVSRHLSHITSYIVHNIIFIHVTTPIINRYISTLSLSLYFFNLLALPFLDGSQVLGAMLDWVCCDPSRTDSSIDAIPLDDLVYISGIDDIEHGGSTPSKSLKQRHSSFAIQTLERWQRWIRRRRVDVERSVYALTSMLLFGAVVGMASSLR